MPNDGKDPEAANPRYRIRGNGVRTFRPALTEAALAEAAYSISGCKAISSSGVEPAKAGEPGRGRLQGRGGQRHHAAADQGQLRPQDRRRRGKPSRSAPPTA